MGLRSSTHDGLPPDDILRGRVKAEIRKRLRGLRKTTPHSACAERSARLIERLEDLPSLRAARKIGLFWPIEERHEVDLRALDARLRARHVAVAYPTILPTHEMIFQTVDDAAAMQEHPLGFLAPLDGAPETDLDVIVVPAIAIDPTGHRIGYGAGHYDRFLSMASAAVTVGVAFDFQLIPEVPATALDVAVHWIVTDRRTLRASCDASLLAPQSDR
jgi:5-formyltetrahydrofolate cyclo-ligase